jgi:hypothetical protein
MICHVYTSLRSAVHCRLYRFVSQTEFITQMAVLLHLYIQPSKGYASYAEAEKGGGSLGAGRRPA